MNRRAIETALTEALAKKQADLVARVFKNRRGHTLEEYVRITGEWWGLEDAKAEIARVVKDADV